MFGVKRVYTPIIRKFRLKIRDHTTRRFVKTSGTRKQRRGVSIAAQDEQNQIVSINLFAATSRQKIELILVFLRRDLWIEFTAHPHNRFLRNGGGREKGFACHTKIALSVIRWDAAFISKSKSN